MPFRIGGYYMSFPTVYRVMEAFEIPNPMNYEDTLLEFAINYWFCDQDKKDVLAAYIHWKDDGPGMMLVSSFKYIPEGMPDTGDLEESDRDRVIIKEWLMKGASVKAEELKWITLVDNRRITIDGIQPKKVVLRKSTKTPAETMAELMEAARKRDLEIASGVFDNDSD